MKFSLRDLFLVTMIVALAVGWWVERRGNNLLRQEVENTSTINAYILKFLKMQGITMEKTESGGVMFKGEGIKRPERKILPEVVNEEVSSP